MAVNTIDYAANLSANTERGPSEVIWGSPGGVGGFIADFLQDPRLGMQYFDDFESAGNAAVGIYPGLAAVTTGSLGRWAFIAPAGGGFGDAAVVGGALQMACGSLAVSSTNQTTEVINSNVGCFQISASSSTAGGLQGKLAFEARVALTSITNGKRDAFVGLIDQGPASSAALQALFPFTQAGSSSNNLTSTYNMIGFYFPSASTTGQPSGDCQFVYGLASTAPVFASNLKGLISNVGGSAIAAGTYYKLGFVYDPLQSPPTVISSASDGQTVGNTAKAMIRIYVNGSQAAAFLTQTQNILTASFPTGVMGPIVAISPAVSGTSNTASNSAGLLNLDWLRVAQNATT